MKNVKALTLIGILAMLAWPVGTPGALAQTAESSENTINIKTAVVQSFRDIQVPARVKGFIAKMNFAEGDFVSEGTVIAQLDLSSIDSELEASEIRFENAQLQADDNTPIDYAEASYAQARQEFQTERELMDRNATTRQELERKRLTARQAELQVVRSKEQKKIDGGAVRIEEQAVKAVQMLKNRHEITAQFSGQIMSIDRKEGESVQEGQTVLRLVDLEQVKVQGKVNSSSYNSYELKGKPVKVTLQLARDETMTFDGYVKRIGLDVQPAGGMDSTFIVEAIVNNQKINEEWLLHPGAPVSMDIQLDDK